MLAQRIFVFSIVVVLVARTLHCCYVGATLCAGAEQAAGDNRLPLTNPDDRDPNETGCICKGAVAIQAPGLFEAIRPSLDQVDPLARPVVAVELAAQLDGAAGRLGDRHLLGPPPLGGMLLRAWLGSLLV